MFFGNKRRIVGLLIAACMLFTSEFQVCAANPKSEAQVMETLSYEFDFAPLASTWEQIPQYANVAVVTQDWYGKALANTETTVDVFGEVNGAVIGKMYKNTVATVLEEGEEWCKVSSGSVEGYVQTSMLLFGSAAVARANVTCAAGTQDAMTLAQIEEQKRNSEVALLAALIFCEAGNQLYEGKVAVGAVVMNRISSSRYPNTLEGVIYQRGQFTPAMTGKLARVLSSGRVPASCYDAAIDALNGAKPIGNALYFNTRHGRFKLGDHYFS
jgi:hypothetical protein